MHYCTDSQRQELPRALQMLRVTSAEDARLGLIFFGVSRDPGGLPDGKDQGAGVDGESRSSVGHTAQVLSLGQSPPEVPSCFCLRVQKCKARPPLTNNNCWPLLMAGAKLFAMSLRFEFHVSNRVYDTDVKFQQNALFLLLVLFSLCRLHALQGCLSHPGCC